MRTILLMLALGAGCDDGTTDTQKQPIGSSCSASADCGTGKFFCDADHPGGYCKASCHKDADCPTGSVCAGAGMVSPGECHKKCAKAADCRLSEGYECKTLPDDATGDYCDVPEATD